MEAFDLFVHATRTHYLHSGLLWILTPALFRRRRADSEGSARAALPPGSRLQPGQIQGVPVPVAHLEEAAPGGLPAGRVGAAAAAAGLLRRRVAPPRQR